MTDSKDSTSFKAVDEHEICQLLAQPVPTLYVTIACTGTVDLKDLEPVPDVRDAPLQRWYLQSCPDNDVMQLLEMAACVGRCIAIRNASSDGETALYYWWSASDDFVPATLNRVKNITRTPLRIFPSRVHSGNTTPRHRYDQYRKSGMNMLVACHNAILLMQKTTAKGPVLRHDDPARLVTNYEWDHSGFDTQDKDEQPGRRWLNFHWPYRHEQLTSDEVTQRYTAAGPDVCGVTLTANDIAKRFLIANADKIRGLSYSRQLFELGVVFEHVEFLVVHSIIYELPSDAITVFPNLKEVIYVNDCRPLLASDGGLAKETHLELTELANEIKATGPLEMSPRVAQIFTAFNRMEADVNLPKRPPMRSIQDTLDIILDGLQSVVKEQNNANPLDVSPDAAQVLSVVCPGSGQFQVHDVSQGFWKLSEQALEQWPEVVVTNRPFLVPNPTHIAIAMFVWLI